MSLRNWRLRSKLALVLAIPTVTALALGTLRATDELSSAKEFDRSTAQVNFALKVTDVVHRLQGERMLAVAKIIMPNDVNLQSALNAQISQVNDSVVDLRTAAQQLAQFKPSLGIESRSRFVEQQYLWLMNNR